MCAATEEAGLPTGAQLCWPTLEAVRGLGGSATVTEIVEAVTEREGFSEALQDLVGADGITTELYRRLANARTYLKAAGALEQSRRGVWAITEQGRQLTETDMVGITGAYQRAVRERREGLGTGVHDGGSVERPGAARPRAEERADLEEVEGWRDQLRRTLLDMEPDAFERLALRLLREAGFTNTVVTRRVADGGIDGSGTYRLSLVSFPVFFQCKRYQGSVSSSAVRDFRGAMAGRGANGLLITTGTFTAEARSESTRAGAPPIDLIDGDRLCDLLKEYSLGVETEIETTERVTVSPTFFTEA